MHFHNMSNMTNNYVLYEGSVLSYIFFSVLLFIVCLCNINCFYMYKNIFNKSLIHRDREILTSSNKLLSHPPSYNSINDNYTYNDLSNDTDNDNDTIISV
jgi:hypothetical protein